MDFILKVSSGEEILLQPGSSVTIGRDAIWNDCEFPSDAFMSPVHFQINVHDVEVSLRDLNSRDGTWVNGIRCSEYVLSPGDVITAGQVRFVFQPFAANETETDEEKSDSTPDGNFPASPLLDEMRKLGERLYALFDLARDPQILEMLGAAGA